MFISFQPFVFACESSKTESSSTSKNTQQTNDEIIDWMADVHQSITNSVYWSALWFDSFFAEQGCEQRQPKTSAKIRLAWRPKSQDLSEFKLRFRLKVKLPHFQNKADLILSDNSDDELSQLPLDNYNKQNNLNNNESFSAAIRFIHKNESNIFTDSRLGISRGDIFIRARHQRLYSVNQKHGFKLEPALYYFLRDGLGAKLLLEYNYQLSNMSQLRFDYSIRASESFNGLKWKHGLYRLSQLGDNKASVMGLTVEGERHSGNRYFANKYTLSYRYRFNAYREWLYFEVEPFVEWEKERNFQGATGIALRVEGYFTKH